MLPQTPFTADNPRTKHHIRYIRFTPTTFGEASSYTTLYYTLTPFHQTTSIQTSSRPSSSCSTCICFPERSCKVHLYKWLKQAPHWSAALHCTTCQLGSKLQVRLLNWLFRNFSGIFREHPMFFGGLAKYGMPVLPLRIRPKFTAHWHWINCTWTFPKGL